MWGASIPLPEGSYKLSILCGSGMGALRGIIHLQITHTPVKDPSDICGLGLRRLVGHRIRRPVCTPFTCSTHQSISSPTGTSAVTKHMANILLAVFRFFFRTFSFWVSIVFRNIEV